MAESRRENGKLIDKTDYIASEGCVGYLLPNGAALEIDSGDTHKSLAQKLGTDLFQLYGEGTARLYAEPHDFLGIEIHREPTRPQVQSLVKAAGQGDFHQFVIETAGKANITGTRYGETLVTARQVRQAIKAQWPQIKDEALYDFNENHDPETGRFDFGSGEPELPLKGGVAYGEGEINIKQGQQSVTGFHGTTDEVYANIKKFGIVPKASKGADEWARQHDLVSAQSFMSGDRIHSVYMTSNPRDAAKFADLAAKVRGQTPIVLRVEIPAAHAAAHLRADLAESREQISMQGGFSMVRYDGTIRSQWIKARHTIPRAIRRGLGGIQIQKRGGAITASSKDADAMVAIYLIVFEPLPGELKAKAA